MVLTTQARHHNQEDQEAQGKAKSAWRQASLWSLLLRDLCPSHDMVFNHIVYCHYYYLWLGSTSSGFHHGLLLSSHQVQHVHGATLADTGFCGRLKELCAETAEEHLWPEAGGLHMEQISCIQALLNWVQGIIDQ
jgi:hypothetical protein